MLALALSASAAWAHGPIDPEASVDRAIVESAPAGTSVRIVDGDLRVWMAVRRGRTVTVLDDQGAPYLRFAATGVAINERSAMFFLNHLPPLVPPTDLSRAPRPLWHHVSDADAYEWHDGRLHALAYTLAAPGARTLGRWRIALRVDGHPAAITGVLEQAPPPTLAWWWPTVVVLLAVPALWRLPRSRAHRRATAALAGVALLAAIVLAIGEGLHGRPHLSGGRLAGLGVELALAGWTARRLAGGRRDPWALAAIALLALYRGLAGIAILFRGEVLLALPGPLARAAVAAALAGGLGLVELIVLEADSRAIRRRPRVARRTS